MPSYITSFKGSDGHSVHPFGEYFGTEFDVYIDAPMLEIDYSRIPEKWLAANNSLLTVDKLRKHPTIPGRFIYSVERERTKEAEYGYSPAYNKDLSTKGFDNYGRPIVIEPGSQEGERKKLPFKKTSIGHSTKLCVIVTATECSKKKKNQMLKSKSHSILQPK